MSSLLFEHCLKKLGKQRAKLKKRKSLYLQFLLLARGINKPRPNKKLSDPNDPNRILPELTSEMVDLTFTQIENDSYRAEFDPNIFCLNYFSFQEKPIGPKNQLTRSRSELKTNPLEAEPEPNHIDLKRPDSKRARSEPEPNDLFFRSKQTIQSNTCFSTA